MLVVMIFIFDIEEQGRVYISPAVFLFSVTAPDAYKAVMAAVVDDLVNDLLINGQGFFLMAVTVR